MRVLVFVLFCLTLWDLFWCGCLGLVLVVALGDVASCFAGFFWCAVIGLNVVRIVRRFAAGCFSVLFMLYSLFDLCWLVGIAGLHVLLAPGGLLWVLLLGWRRCLLVLFDCCLFCFWCVLVVLWLGYVGLC